MTEVHGEAVPASGLDAELSALAQPLRQRLARIEEELATVQALEAGLRADRMKVVTALRAVDPTFTMKFGGGKHGKNSNGRSQSQQASDASKMSDARLQPFHEWLLSVRDELPARGITGTQLSRRPDCPLGTDGTARALRILHDRGVVRLDHTGTGGSKFYVLV